MLYRLYADGACKNNGSKYARASIGGIIYGFTTSILDESDEKCKLKAYSEYLKPTPERPAKEITNNVAEYESLIYGLKLLVEMKAQQVEILMDSNLVVQQTLGNWKVNFPHLKVLHKQVLDLLQFIPHYTILHIPRAQNSVADGLANAAIEKNNNNNK